MHEKTQKQLCPSTISSWMSSTETARAEKKQVLPAEGHIQAQEVLHQHKVAFTACSTFCLFVARMLVIHFCWCGFALQIFTQHCDCQKPSQFQFCRLLLCTLAAKSLMHWTPWNQTTVVNLISGVCALLFLCFLN